MERPMFSTTFSGRINHGSQVAVNSGSITNHFHAPAPVSAPPPTIQIPFRRDRNFVKRTVLKEICQRASVPAARVAICGLGGVGKTQLAIEYAYRRRVADPQLWVFWVHASSSVRFEESYRKIALQVGISAWADPTADILSLVYNWLSDEQNGQWMMVVDNADSEEVVFGSRHKGDASLNTTTHLLSRDRTVAACLPSPAHGSLVITTRNRKVADGLIEYSEDILEVLPMEEFDSIALLQCKLEHTEQQPDQKDAARLVQALDYMPLAITQAAAYIRQVGIPMTVLRYLELLGQSDSERERLLRQSTRDPRRDGEASNSIITTWHTSFEHIRQTRASAARLLALMSQFNREGIPKRLLARQYYPSATAARESQSLRKGKRSLTYRIKNILSKSSSDRLQAKVESTSTSNADDFKEDVQLLRAYKLIGIDTSEELYEMHRLVQYSTQRWLDLCGELEVWQRRYVSVLVKAVPEGEYEHWQVCQALFPHVEILLHYQTAAEDTKREHASVLRRGASYAWRSGQYEIGLQMAQASLQDFETLFGANDMKTLGVMNLLALIFEAQGKYGRAEELNRQVLARLEKKLGLSRPDTLSSINNLAVTLQQQGKCSEAEKLHQQVLARREKALGQSHPDTLWSMSNLAMTLYQRGRYSEAETLHRQVLARMEKALGSSHPQTLSSMNSLAATLQQQGKYSEAEKLHRQALAGREKKLGLSHPNILISMNNLALTLLQQGRHSEAETLLQQALAGGEKQLGANHPDTLRSVYNLAYSLHSSREYEAALPLYDRAFHGLTAVLGPSHPDTLGCQWDQQRLLRDMESSL